MPVKLTLFPRGKLNQNFEGNIMIIKGAELWFPKLDPKRPNAKFNKKNPTWEIQIRTKSKEVKNDWTTKNLLVKAVVPDDGEPYWRVNLRKKSIKQDGEASSPVTVVNGKLEDIDPNSVGNGSVGNVRVYQYEYDKKDGGKGIVSVLMGIQVTKQIVFKMKPRGDEFEEDESEVIEPDVDSAADEDDEKF
jgi:hypothetical protein